VTHDACHIFSRGDSLAFLFTSALGRRGALVQRKLALGQPLDREPQGPISSADCRLRVRNFLSQ
jgi:hypothetical protein